MAVFPQYFYNPSDWYVGTGFYSRFGFKVGDEVDTNKFTGGKIVELAAEHAVVQFPYAEEMHAIAYNRLRKVEKKQKETEVVDDFLTVKLEYDSDDSHCPIRIVLPEGRGNTWLTIDGAHKLKSDLDRLILKAYSQYDYTDDDE